MMNLRLKVIRSNRNVGPFPCAAVILVLFFATGTVAADAIRVSWDPEKVIRGGVVALRVQSPLDLMTAEATVGVEKFPLIKATSREFIALVGIDLDQDRPTLPVDFAFFPAKGGSHYRIHADLRIRETGAAPEIQRLSLPSGMVDFSEERLQQIHQENKIMSDTCNLRIRQRFWDEGFLMPVTGRISTRFGTRRVLNGKPGSSHNGLDIAGRKGTPVRSSNSGRVLLVDDFYLSGQTVVVDHGWGLSTVYAHLDSISVSEGQEVKRGQTLGTVGATGRATGPHLHFGALIRGVKVDPLQLMDVTRDLTRVKR